MIIRPADMKDRQAIAAVQAKSWQSVYQGMLPADYLANDVADDLERQWMETELRPEDVVLVAEADCIIGFIAIWCNPDPFIDNLHVDPERRSQGLGGRLMAAAGAELVARGHTSAYLWVLADNLGAIRFYERLGGQSVETADKDIFGHACPAVKIAWSNLELMHA